MTSYITSVLTNDTLLVIKLYTHRHTIFIEKILVAKRGVSFVNMQVFCGWLRTEKNCVRACAGTWYSVLKETADGLSLYHVDLHKNLRNLHILSLFASS